MVILCHPSIGVMRARLAALSFNRPDKPQHNGGPREPATHGRGVQKLSLGLEALLYAAEAR